MFKGIAWCHLGSVSQISVWYRSQMSHRYRYGIGWCTDQETWEACIGTVSRTSHHSCLISRDVYKMDRLSSIVPLSRFPWRKSLDFRWVATNPETSRMRQKNGIEFGISSSSLLNVLVFWNICDKFGKFIVSKLPKRTDKKDVNKSNQRVTKNIQIQSNKWSCWCFFWKLHRSTRVGFFVVSTGLLQVHDDLFYMDVPDVLMIQDIYMMHWT